MFCPECGSEYQSGVTRCADCGVELTAAPPAAPTAPEWVGLVTVLKTCDEAELAVARSLLEAEGILCMLRAVGPQGIVDFGQLSGATMAMNPIELRVRSDDAEAARELLAAQDLRLVEAEEAAPLEGEDEA